MRLVITTITLLSLSLLSSCGNPKLTNEEALVILQSEYKNDCFGTVRGKINNSNENNYLETEKVFLYLETLGLAHITYKDVAGYSRYFTEISWKPTEECKNRYLQRGTNLYHTTKAQVTEVIGISHNDEANTAIVKFAYSLEETPFYKIKIPNYNTCELADFEEEATFVRYDTGWNMKQE